MGIRRQEEERRLAEEARLAAEAEAARLAEEARLAAEAETRRQEEEQRLAEESRLVAEAEASRLAAEAETARLTAEAEAACSAEKANVEVVENEATATRDMPVDLEIAAKDCAELPAVLKAELPTIEQADLVKVNGVNEEMPPPFLLFDKKCGETILDADLRNVKIGQLPKMAAKGNEYVDSAQPYTELDDYEVDALKPQPQFVAFVGKWYKLLLLLSAIVALVVVGVLERKAIQFTV